MDAQNAGQFFRGKTGGRACLVQAVAEAEFGNPAGDGRRKLGEGKCFHAPILRQIAGICRIFGAPEWSNRE